jgi:hypothetical protein
MGFFFVNAPFLVMKTRRGVGSESAPLPIRVFKSNGRKHTSKIRARIKKMKSTRMPKSTHGFDEQVA